MADRSEFDLFVATRSQALLRTSYLLAGDWAAAEDLLQVALTKSWLAWGRIDGPPEPYVRKVLTTTYTTWWRRRWRGEQPHARLPEGGTEEHFSSVDERDVLIRALRALPRQQRAVVVLRYYEDLSEAETAATLGISKGTVKSHAARALQALRRDGTLHGVVGGAQ